LLTPLFEPIVRNPHLLTIAGNFWRRQIDEIRFPSTRKLYQVDGQNTILVKEHQAPAVARGQIVFLHGLEGSDQAGYMQSFAQAALERGFGVHRKNMRSCGGTEELCQTMYHSGLTEDTRFIAQRLLERFGSPIFVVGFSLGGNVALKLAGELGETDLLAGVCAVSTPIDLARCVRQLDKPGNFIYARRFLSRLQARVRRKSQLSPDTYSVEGLDSVRGIWQFDDRFTAPLFGFGTAENYYRTQSCWNYLDRIRIPTLVIAAKDDPLVPFAMYEEHPAFRSNPALHLMAPESGGHLGFLSKHRPRFWLDGVALDFLESLACVRSSELRA
jgi:hypothetical protein